MQDLIAYPLRFAKEDVRGHLLKRGQLFWDQMRFTKHIAYGGWCWYKEWNYVGFTPLPPMILKRRWQN